ncbi:TraR/DksA family transcriptional regulator [Aquabacterium sp.]|uniref:TraR/DksA family transcriptional regulator n=1 Tax=Aquabacterium sp. TaxID=1872578 RepID=UPI0035AE4C78
MPAPRVPASPLDAATVATLHERLQQMERDLQAGIAHQRSQLATHDAATSNAFVAGNEGALTSESDDEALAMLSHEEIEWAAVQAALARIKDGRYGSCAQCDEPIGRERLMAVPYATLCVACQQSDESRGHGGQARAR